jgi:hypothetical protein
MANRAVVRSATKPGCKTRAATTKQLSSRATAKVAAVKTAKLEADMKKRKASPPPTIPTPASKKVEEEEDDATDIPPVIDNRTTLRLPSPATKRQQELGQQVTEEDLRRMREAQ